MSTSASTKVHVVLNASGQIALVSRVLEYKPAQAGDEPELTFGVVPEPGQTIVEVELPHSDAKLQGNDLLDHMARHASVQAALSRYPASSNAGASRTSQEVTSGTL